MKSYAECADIAAKAVKVLQSTKRESHRKMAERYAELALELIKNSGLALSIKADSACLLIKDVMSAKCSMELRLHRPRYVRRGGEWVLCNPIK